MHSPITILVLLANHSVSLTLAVCTNLLLLLGFSFIIIIYNTFITSKCHNNNVRKKTYPSANKRGKGGKEKLGRQKEKTKNGKREVGKRREYNKETKRIKKGRKKRENKGRR